MVERHCHQIFVYCIHIGHCRNGCSHSNNDYKIFRAGVLPLTPTSLNLVSNLKMCLSQEIWNTFSMARSYHQIHHCVASCSVVHPGRANQQFFFFYVRLFISTTLTLNLSTFILRFLVDLLPPPPPHKLVAHVVRVMNVPLLL